jgi:hypothetical protein
MTFIGVNQEWLKEHDTAIRKEERETYAKELHEKLMAASINNENPGWVQITNICKILFGDDYYDHPEETLQEFPFRSDKKSLRGAP